MISTTYAILAFCFMYVKLIHSGDIDFTTETETTECLPGYTGENCGIPCRYPSFGQACQEICICKEKECDSVTGCRELLCNKTCNVKQYQCCSIISNTNEHCVSWSRLFVVCPVGYTGDRCEIPCHFPNYGDRCQMACSCAEEFCNFTYGCSTSSTIDSRNGHQTPTRTTIMMTIKQTEIIGRPCDGCTKNRANNFEFKTKTVLFMSIVAIGALEFIVLIVYAYSFSKHL